MKEPKDLRDDNVKAIAQRVSERMIIEYGEEGAAFLFRSGKLGAAFARFTYFEVRAELEKKR